MSPNSKPPIGLAWRAGYWFTTLVVGCGIAIDLLVYSIIIPVVPFQLDKLGYENISSLAGWLLFAYSGGLLGATIPIAQISERYNERRWPLIIGFIVLIGSQVMFMEAPNYALMCVARVLQGIGSAIVWTVGLALLADATPEQRVGQQLGIAMMGVNAGLVLGPPLGGALYTRFGFRGPFVFGIAASFLDLVGRFLIIERKDSIKWGFDPHYVKGEVDSVSDLPPSEKAGLPSVPTTVPPEPTNRGHGQETATAEGSETVESSGDTPKHKTLPLVTVIARLSKSSRALAASFATLLWGIIFTGLEPSLPVHLQRVWGLSSGGVGLVFIAAVVPGLISSPATGYISDKRGAEYVATACFFLAIPWTVVLMLEKGLALFVVAFAFMSFFMAGVVSPLTVELAAVSRNIEGVGYGHVYAAYNLAYAVGSTIGPIIGGQMYDNLTKGWRAICFLGTGLMALGTLIALVFVGERPLLRCILGRS